MGSAGNCLAEQWLTRQSISRVEASWPEGGAGHGPHLRPWIDPRETGVPSPRPAFQDCAFPPPSADTCLSQRWPTSRAQPTHGAIGPCVPIPAPSAPPASTRSIPVDDPGGRPLMDPGAPGAPPPHPSPRPGHGAERLLGGVTRRRRARLAPVQGEPIRRPGALPPSSRTFTLTTTRPASDALAGRSRNETIFDEEAMNLPGPRGPGRPGIRAH
jgi:hypothetical protein